MSYSEKFKNTVKHLTAWNNIDKHSWHNRHDSQNDCRSRAVLRTQARIREEQVSLALRGDNLCSKLGVGNFISNYGVTINKSVYIYPPISWKKYFYYCGILLYITRTKKNVRRGVIIKNVFLRSVKYPIMVMRVPAQDDGPVKT